MFTLTTLWVQLEGFSFNYSFPQGLSVTLMEESLATNTFNLTFFINTDKAMLIPVSFTHLTNKLCISYGKKMMISVCMVIYDLYDLVPIEIFPMYCDPPLSQSVSCDSINFPNHALCDLVTDSKECDLMTDTPFPLVKCKPQTTSPWIMWLTYPHTQYDESDISLPICCVIFTLPCAWVPCQALHDSSCTTWLKDLFCLCCMLHTTWDHLSVADQTLHFYTPIFPVYCAISIIQ